MEINNKARRVGRAHAHATDPQDIVVTATAGNTVADAVHKPALTTKSGEMMPTTVWWRYVLARLARSCLVSEVYHAFFDFGRLLLFPAVLTAPERI